VQSKRLGRSLGINLSPLDRKVCSFDCVYCHYGRTIPGPYTLPDSEEILEEVKEALLKRPEIDFITFAGHGEPTLHMDLLKIAASIVKMRDEIMPEIKVALLTNSSTLSRPDVASVCKTIDAPICKLDAGDEETFRRVNRARPNIRLEDIVRNIRATPNAIVQIMMVEGELGNASEKDIDKLIHALNEAAPSFVQVYSIDYPFEESSLVPVSNEELQRIADVINRETGIEARAYWELN
jgi:wyosine [tRNA(Phe)-imidazoG37] synthetase (radical SAM superfamily)